MALNRGKSKSIASARQEIFSRLWAHYRGLVPQVPRIEDALRAKGEVWSEDHVAFRTFPGAGCGAHVLQGIFEALGYERQESLHFEDKKLDAFWLKPPVPSGAHSAEVSPKVFVSELLPASFSPPMRMRTTHRTTNAMMPFIVA
jgi:hypothetical protein